MNNTKKALIALCISGIVILLILMLSQALTGDKETEFSEEESTENNSDSQIDNSIRIKNIVLDRLNVFRDLSRESLNTYIEVPLDKQDLTSLAKEAENNDILYEKYEIVYKKTPSIGEGDIRYHKDIILHSPLTYETWITSNYKKTLQKQDEEILRLEIKSPDKQLQYRVGNKAYLDLFQEEKYTFSENTEEEDLLIYINNIIEGKNVGAKQRYENIIKLLDIEENEGSRIFSFNINIGSFYKIVKVEVNLSENTALIIEDKGYETDDSLIYEMKLIDHSKISFTEDLFNYDELSEVEIQENTVE